jgi:hypothetical protein
VMGGLSVSGSDSDNGANGSCALLEKSANPFPEISFRPPGVSGKSNSDTDKMLLRRELTLSLLLIPKPRLLKPLFRLSHGRLRVSFGEKGMMLAR